MAYDEDLANRIRELIAAEPDVTEQRMFGGLAFLVAGNMAVAASGQGGLMVRVDPEGDEAWRTGPHVRPFEMRGRAVRGWRAGRRRGPRHEAPARAVGPARRGARALAPTQALTRGARPRWGGRGLVAPARAPRPPSTRRSAARRGRRRRPQATKTGVPTGERS